MKNIRTFFKKNNLLVKILLFIIVLSFTFVLRAHNYGRSPEDGNLEEMLFAWSGIYLVETGIPVSWSELKYPERALVYTGKMDYKGGLPSAYVKLYKPWLDEPPLFSWIVGYTAHLNHVDRNGMIPAVFTRMPMILFAALTSIFVFLVARLLSGYWIGILSMFIYGTVPVMVLGSRLAVPENLIMLFFMIMIYLLLKFEDHKRFIYLIPIPILAGLGGLAKPTGYFIIFLAIYFVFKALFKEKRKKQILLWIAYLFFGTVPFVLFYIWYGLSLDKEIFWQIVSIQGQRPVGFSSLGWFFISPGFDWRMLKDSWYIFCLLAAAFFIFQPPDGKKQFIIFSFIYWVIIVMLSGGEGDQLSWYRYPSFPLLAIIGAWGLVYLVKRADFFASFIAAGLLLGNRSLLVNVFNPNVTPVFYRSVFSFLMLPSLLNYIFNRKILEKLSKVIIIGVIIVGFYINIKYIYIESDLRCQGADCILGPSTSLSSLYFPFFWRFFSLDPATGFSLK